LGANQKEVITNAHRISPSQFSNQQKAAAAAAAAAWQLDRITSKKLFE
jgi:hypothetical protein